MTYRQRVVTDCYCFRETEPDWVQDLETDVKQECLRFGQVEHIQVNEESMASKLSVWGNSELE